MRQYLYSSGWRRCENPIAPNCAAANDSGKPLPNSRYAIAGAMKATTYAQWFFCFIASVSIAVPAFCFAWAQQSADPQRLPAPETTALAQAAGATSKPSAGTVASPVSKEQPAQGETVPQQAGNEDRAPQTTNEVGTRNYVDVSYGGGLLTIDAHNVPLVEVLKLVSQKTGAIVEIPPGCGLERVVEHTGPAPAKDVVSHLLNGSTFNFFVVNSPDRPQELQRVVLSLQGPEVSIPAARQPTVATASNSSFLYKPPGNASSVDVLPARLDVSLTLPDDTATMSPEARGEFMRSKFNELREKAQQQYPH